MQTQPPPLLPYNYIILFEICFTVMADQSFRTIVFYKEKKQYKPYHGNTDNP